MYGTGPTIDVVLSGRSFGQTPSAGLILGDGSFVSAPVSQVTATRLVMSTTITNGSIVVIVAGQSSAPYPYVLSQIITTPTLSSVSTVNNSWPTSGIPLGMILVGKELTVRARRQL